MLFETMFIDEPIILNVPLGSLQPKAIRIAATFIETLFIGE